MRYLKETEVDAFQKAAQIYQTRGSLDYRPYLISTLMLQSGLRVSEVVGEHYDYYVNDKGERVSPRPTPKEAETAEYQHKKYKINGIRVENVDKERSTLQLYAAKGDKDRLVPLTDEEIMVIGAYLSATDRNFATIGPLIDISVDRVQVWFRKIAQSANMRNVHPHMLRHTFSVRFLNAGGDIRVLQKILGHSSLAITEKYLDYVFADVEANFKKIMNRYTQGGSTDEAPDAE